MITTANSGNIWDFVSRCALPNECWIWCGRVNENGYGWVSDNGKLRLAHRVAYEKVKGSIPSGLVLDHLCGVPGCVNPNHLEAVTQQENLRRGNGVCAKRSRQTHCKNGHEFTPENTARNSVRPTHRKCKACQRAYDAKRIAARKASRVAAVA